MPVTAIATSAHCKRSASSRSKSPGVGSSPLVKSRHGRAASSARSASIVVAASTALPARLRPARPLLLLLLLLLLPRRCAMTERTDDFLAHARSELNAVEIAAISKLLLAYKRQPDPALELGDAIGDGWLRVNDKQAIAELNEHRDEQGCDPLDMSDPHAVAKAAGNWTGKQKKKARQLRGVSLDNADADADADDAAAAAAHAVVAEIAKSTATPELIWLAFETLREFIAAQLAAMADRRGGRPKGDLNKKKLKALLVLARGKAAHGGGV